MLSSTETQLEFIHNIWYKKTGMIRQLEKFVDIFSRFYITTNVRDKQTGGLTDKITGLLYSACIVVT